MRLKCGEKKRKACGKPLILCILYYRHPTFDESVVTSS
jgi:hypothetical protein